MEKDIKTYDDTVITLKSLYEQKRIDKTKVQLLFASKKITLEEYEYIIKQE